MAQEESERNLRDELNAVIGQYLQRNGFSQTYVAFLEESASQRQSFLSTATDVDDDSDNKCKECMEELFRFYDAGNGVEFFKTLEKAIPGICSSQEFFKLEFSLQLHFGIFSVRNSVAKQDASCTPGFKSYLEGRGSRLSREPEYLPYFALPFIQNPSQHPSFVDLFKDSWVTDLREQLNLYLTPQLKQTFRSPKRDLLNLMEIYKKYRSPNDGQRTCDEEVDKMKTQLQGEHQKIVKLQDNYQKLMHITTELLSALETSVKGEDVNLSEVMDTCLHAFPELFNQGSVNGLREMRASPDGFNVATDAGNSGESSERRHTPLLRSKTHGLLLSTISFQQLKRDLANGAPRLKMFILQALRWRITKSDPGEQRQSVMSTFISNDLMGVRGGEYGDAVLSLIMTPTIELRQSMARLLNALASLTSGRSYLSHGPNILIAIMDNVQLNKLETTSLDMSIATLQKLSLRRQLQTSMIEHNIIEWLLSLLDEEDSLSDYALEYAVALLMNLCLRTAGKQRCTRSPHMPLKVLTNLLGSQNQEIIPYVNGTLYSLLTVSVIKKEAQSMGLEDMLHIFLKESHPEMKRQLEFILRQLAAEDPVEDVMSDYEDEDDDDEEQDVLEDELDKDDLVVILPGELQGEQLLAAYYSVATNTAKSKPQDILLRRPSTPTRTPGSASRRNASPRVVAQQLSELSTDSMDGPSTGIWSLASHPLSPNQTKPSDGFSPTFNVDHYASHMLNEVVGIEKPVAEAVSFPPVLPREPDKFGGSSVNEYVVAFSSRPKIPRSPEHSSKRHHSPASHSR